MRIGFVATHLAGIDQVSLETNKWVTVLKEMGHDVYFCAGELNQHGPPGKFVPEMHPFYPTVRELNRRAFDGTDPRPDIVRELQRRARGLRIHIETFLENFNINILVVPDSFSNPNHLALGLALYNVINETGFPTIAHHHDFFWERERFLVHRIPSLLRLAFPPILPSVQHVVTSTVMQRALQVHSGLTATVIPYVFDFENPPPPPDDYAKNFRSDVGFQPDDILFLQPSRLIARRSIERSIDLARLLTHRRYKVVITGSSVREPGPQFEWLIDEAIRAGVETYFIADRMGTERNTGEPGGAVYTMGDVFSQCDLVTYPNYEQGYGGTLTETLYYRRPLVVNRYAAYRADLAPAGVQAIEIDDVVTPGTAVAALDLLNNPDRVAAMVEHNYEIGRERFAYSVLRSRLETIFEGFEAQNML